MGRIEWRVEKDGKQVVAIDGLRKPVGLSVPEGVQVRWCGESGQEKNV